MTIHKTESGYIELLQVWRDGQRARCNFAAMPGVIVSDNGDGENSAWKVTGRMRDAAKVIGHLEIGTAGKIARFFEKRIVCESIPDNFWVENSNGDFMANPGHDVVAY